jgi:hypothetical protein
MACGQGGSLDVEPAGESRRDCRGPLTGDVRPKKHSIGGTRAVSRIRAGVEAGQPGPSASGCCSQVVVETIRPTNAHGWATYLGNPGEHSPDDPARDVEGEEPPPRHPVGSGQEGRQHPQNRDKALEENHRAAMAHEQVLAELDLPGREAQARPEPDQQGVADPLADPEADVVADHRPGHRSGDDPGQRQVVRRPGVDGCCDEGRLTGKGQAQALQHDHDQDQPVAVGRD